MLFSLLGFNIWMVIAVVMTLAFLYLLLRPDPKRYSIRETMELLGPQLDRRGFKMFRPVVQDFTAGREDINWRERLTAWIAVVQDEDDFVEQFAKPFIRANIHLFVATTDERANWLDTVIQSAPGSDRKLCEQPVQKKRLRTVETVTADIDDRRPQLNIQRRSDVEAFATDNQRQRYTAETEAERALRERGYDPDVLDEDDIETALKEQKPRRRRRRK
ncbi:MAG: hypothetical protein AAFP90_07385 [Planctomycetota bacterium]